MSDTTNLEIGAALADLVAMAEKNTVTFSEMVTALKALILKEDKEDKEVCPPVVNVDVAAPTVNVAAPSVTVQASPTTVHIVEPEAKRTRLTVNRNPSGFIESIDIEVIAGSK